MKQDMIVILDLGSTKNTDVAGPYANSACTAKYIPTIYRRRICRNSIT